MKTIEESMGSTSENILCSGTPVFKFMPTGSSKTLMSSKNLAEHRVRKT